MRSEENVKAWLGCAPSCVTQATDRLLAHVEELRAGQTIYPAQDDILNALAYTGPTAVSVVILGQDPYHGPGQAMGLSFSVPEGVKIPPSLRNIYKELSSDIGCTAPSTGDLTPWAEQGVLLLNTSLTVRAHEAGSHAKLGWKVLTDYIVATCARLPQPVVFLAWGRPAVGMVENALRDPEATANKFCLASTHPSPLSANRAAAEFPAFIGSKPFSQANRILQDHGARAIDWASVCD